MSPLLQKKVWCGECHAFLGKHVAIRIQNRERYGGFELAPGMVPLGDHAYGPSPRPRGRPRSNAGLIHKKRGTITVQCLRCNAAQVVAIGPATVLSSRPIRTPEIG